MSLIRMTLRFLYDLLVGDSWPLTVGVIAVVGTAIGFVRIDLLPTPLLAASIASLMMVVAPLAMIGEVYRRSGQGKH